MTSGPVLEVRSSKAELVRAVGERLAAAIHSAQADRGIAHIVLTGGSMGSAVLAPLAEDPLRGLVDWSTLHVWWGDERFLPAGDPDRNDTQARTALLDKVPLEPDHVHVVADPSAGSAEDAAREYAAALVAYAAPGATVPAFDVLMLGVGPDGHVASLFPDHPALGAAGSVTAVHDSPKPPPTRVSLTFSALGAAQQVWFLVAGADKADAVAAALRSEDLRTCPAAAVAGQAGTVWWLDREAAAQVSALGAHGRPCIPQERAGGPTG